MLLAILTDPFSAQVSGSCEHQTTYVDVALDALVAVITSCWPRITSSQWMSDIVDMVVVCWLNNNSLSTDGTVDKTKCEAAASCRSLSSVELDQDYNRGEETRLPSNRARRRHRLRDEIVPVLRAVFKAENVELDEYVRPLVEVEASLGGLFAAGASVAQ